MSSRLPAELIWQEHSKPAIQNERKSGFAFSARRPWLGSVCRAARAGRRSGPMRLPGFMCGLKILRRHHIQGALGVHQPLAPFPLELALLLAARPARGERNLLDGEFRSPVG